MKKGIYILVLAAHILTFTVSSREAISKASGYSEAEARIVSPVNNMWTEKMRIVARYHSIGIEAFYPKKGSMKKYSCPINSKKYMEGLCVCNKGYFYDYEKSKAHNSVTACFQDSSINVKKSLFPTFTCPSNSKFTPDGKDCLCGIGYQADTSKMFCVQKIQQSKNEKLYLSDR